MRPAHEDLNGYPVAPHLTSYPRVMIHGYDTRSRSLEGLKPPTFHVLKLGRLQRVSDVERVSGKFLRPRGDPEDLGEPLGVLWDP